MVATVKSRVKLTRRISLGTDVCLFTFQVVDRLPRFKPGQFIQLALDVLELGAHWPESRPFSIASAPKNKDCFSLVISRVGGFTSRIFNELTEGKEAWIKGPYGDFLIEDHSDSTTVCIAGGTGIAPFASFLEDLEYNHKTLKSSFQLYYSVKDEASLSFDKLLNSVEQKEEKFLKSIYLTRESKKGYRHGRINVSDIMENLADAETARFYLCGPEEMVKEYQNQLLNSYGVKAANVFVEDWK